MRIAMISLHTSPADLPGEGDAGGMNVVERQQADALAALGHEVLFLTRRTDPALPEVGELGPGVTLRQVEAGPARVVAKSAVSDHVEAFAEQLERLAEPVDVVHSQHWMSGVAGIGWARRLGVPHVQSFHSLAVPVGRELHEGEPAETEGRVAGERMLAQESDLVVAISRAECTTVLERCGARPERVVVVPPGVDLQLFSPPAGRPADVEPPRGRGHGYVVFAARLQPLKAPDLAIAAVAGMPAEIRPHLVMVGGVSPDFARYRSEVEQLVEQLGLTDWVTFSGPQDRQQLAQLLRGAGALLVPSWSETFGLVALEAAASGTPVVAYDAGGLREAVVDGVTGVLVDSREPSDWSAALARVTAPGTRETMSAAARAHAERFTPELAGERLLRCYQELLR
ncbi:glycosyltransferase [Auraticoccus sp. F435]|uniref:Glycosyltransferase n=1 Tax=Auraticoccus cholistanensis TaxID=2656650 RepID=A0A6A9V1Y5_9ACTN|nr:glycosyltransferase [Auraticoccus cholistanensis]MVA77579.1 glycosyltransferase [Auraticoccus cholistanensis]